MTTTIVIDVYISIVTFATTAIHKYTERFAASVVTALLLQLLLQLLLLHRSLLLLLLLVLLLILLLLLRMLLLLLLLLRLGWSLRTFKFTWLACAVAFLTAAGIAPEANKMWSGSLTSSQSRRLRRLFFKLGSSSALESATT